MSNYIYFGDNLEYLKQIKSESIDLIYIDPPFNTGKYQVKTQIKTIKSNEENYDRVGFQGTQYKTIILSKQHYIDIFDNYLDFLHPRLNEAYRVLKRNGSLFFHIDYREVHYCKILLDAIFGRNSFMNEIIWAYDFGARSKKKWSTKHDNILWYAKNPKKYTFNYEEIDRIPYMSPELVGPEKAKRGKTLTDTWWHTIVPTNSKEKTTYPNQKPLGILKRIIKVHSNPGEIVLDFFAGSGTTGMAAYELNRKFILIDNNIQAIQTMAKRFNSVKDIVWVNYNPNTQQN